MPKTSGQTTGAKGKRARKAPSRAPRAKAPSRTTRKTSVVPATTAVVPLHQRFTPTSHAYAALCYAGAKAAVAANRMQPARSSSNEHPKTRPGDDFTLIRGIDRAIERQMRALGYETYAAIADLNAEDVALIGRALGDTRRLSRDGWIEQAAILACGQLTAFARGAIRDKQPGAVIITFPGKNRYAHISVAKRPKARPKKKPAKSRPLPTATRRKRKQSQKRPQQTKSNVIPFPSERVTPTVQETDGTVVTLTTSLVFIALTALSTLGWNTTIAPIVSGMSCTDTLPTLFVACQHLPALIN